MKTVDTENTADGEGDVRRQIWEEAREHERAERAWGQGREPAPALVDSKGKKAWTWTQGCRVRGASGAFGGVGHKL